VTDLHLAATTAQQTPGDMLVALARWRDGALVLLPGSALGPGLRKRVTAATASLAAHGTTDPIRFPAPAGISATTVCVVAVSEDSPEQVRRAVGAALRTASGVGTAVLDAAAADGPGLRALAEGAALGAYRFTRYRSAAPPAPEAAVLALGRTPDATAREAVSTAAGLAAAVDLARDLVNTAPNDLPPGQMARTAQELFADTDVDVKVWTDAQLRRGRFGGLTAVGQGSANPPRLVRLHYRGHGAGTHVALVGKGITFDSGGLSLKPAKAMEWMKADMAGAAAVLATVKLAHEWKLPVEVTGWLALAENMPGATAQRPGDVISIRGGKTVEVLNTDAEGRLVLADALVEAATGKPDQIIDVATLTGAQLVALGSRVAGAMGNDEELRAAVVAAGDAAGEALWPMPLPPELRPSLDSPIADIANIGDRNGGMLTAALFLKEFVPAGTPWVHLDIAGPAFNEGAPWGYQGKGGTGFAVRTLAEHLRRLSA
jgi:leucyl aminopeptidase